MIIDIRHVKITSLHRDVNSATSFCSEILRLMDSPETKSEKSGGRISCFTEGVYMHVPRFSSEKICSTERRTTGIKTRCQNSSRAHVTTYNFWKERVHREELSKSVSLMSAVFARQNSRIAQQETLQQERCARSEVWDLTNIVCVNLDVRTMVSPML